MPGAALEQAHGQPLFESAQLQADGGLGTGDAFTGPRQAPSLGDRDEGFEPIETDTHGLLLAFLINRRNKTRSSHQ